MPFEDDKQKSAENSPFQAPSVMVAEAPCTASGYRAKRNKIPPYIRFDNSEAFFPIPEAKRELQAVFILPSCSSSFLNNSINYNFNMR